MPKKMSFEEARAKWLKELNGRDMAEYGNDLEKEQDAKVAKLMTPEYVAQWGKAKEDAKGN